MRGFIALDAPPTCGAMSDPGRSTAGDRRQRLGIGHVESRAQAPAGDVVDERVGVDERHRVRRSRRARRRAAPTARHRRRCAWSTSPPGSVTMRISVCGKQLGQLVDAVHRHPVFDAGARGDHRELHLERRRAAPRPPCRRRRSRAAAPGGRRGSSRELGCPAALVLRAHERGQSPLRCERQGEGELGGRGLVHRRRVREDVAGREVLLDALVADRLALHEPGAHLGEPTGAPSPSTCTAARRCRCASRGAAHPSVQTSSSTPSGSGCSAAASCCGRNGHDQRRDAWFTPPRYPPRGRSARFRAVAPAILSARAAGLAGGGGHGSRDQLLGGTARDGVEHGRRSRSGTRGGCSAPGGRSSRTSTWIVRARAR